MTTTRQETGPLVLGSSGRIGRQFRHLVDAGHWPGPRPLLHFRDDPTLGWDMTRPPPRDGRFDAARGVIVLAGGTGGDPDINRVVARAAIDLAARDGLGPVLLCSSSAVYGAATGPQPEDGDVSPATGYGHAKRAMETAVDGSGACCLRIGNVAGADMLLTNAQTGHVTLDRFADGTGPRRCYIGPLTLVRTMVTLLMQDQTLPAVLNVAAPGLTRMDHLLDAADIPYHWRTAPPSALRSLELDTALLRTLAPITAAAGTPDALMAEARLAGWTARS